MSVVKNLGDRRILHALARISAILAFTLLASSAFAQREMYPQKQGQTQLFEWDKLPSWMTLDMEIRDRLEDQTALNYVPGKERLYDLTRVHGGLTVRPTEWLTGYLQFHDLHALGLPLRDVASNMRDTFDFRQGWHRPRNRRSPRGTPWRQMPVFRLKRPESSRPDPGGHPAG